MATSTHETAAPAGGATTAVRAPANGHSNRVLAASNDAVAASEEPRTLGHANRPRKRAHGETDEAAQATDTHGGTRVVERDKRLRVEATGAARESDVAEQLTQLTHQNEQLRSEMAALKDDLAQRDNTMDRVVGSLGSLEQVERETKVLQAKYDECAQKELAMIQDTKQRISDVLGKLDQLQRAGSLTAHELQGFRQDYNRQIDAVLAKVDALASATSQRTAPPHVDAVTAEEIHQLRDELAICKDELTEMEPRRASVENEFFQRMERFSNQLDHVRLQMSKMEQDLLQENAVSRRSLENLVSRQMAQHRHAQAGENKRLREEMDELRSDMCELLKEMHLLKERTKYLGRESTTRRGSGSIGLPGRSSSLSFPPRYTSNELRHSTPASSPLYATGYTSYLYAPPTQSRVPVHGDDELYCQHHHCPAGIPHGVAHGPPIEARASSPSPPRLTQSALLQAAASQAVPARLAVPVGDHHDLPRFCPSPHYSSRSSSVSGRISATRDEHAQADDAHVDDQELERRLLEKHRLFWIREGAGSVSQASLEPPTPKFPDEE